MRTICIMMTALVGMLPLSYAKRCGTTPVAYTGSNQNVETGSLVSMDGSGSRDTDDDPLVIPAC